MSDKLRRDLEDIFTDKLSNPDDESYKRVVDCISDEIRYRLFIGPAESVWSRMLARMKAEETKK